MVRNIFSLLLFFHLPAPRCATSLINPNFIYISDEMPWWEAQAYCRRHYTDLLTIRNMEEDQETAKYKVWIGLHREISNSEWKWSRGGEKANFTNWKDDEPSDSRNCVLKEASEKGWTSKDCTDNHTFFCYDERLVLVQELKTWEEALQHCRALQSVNATPRPPTYHNHRYDLATLKNASDFFYGRKMAQEAATAEVWTGLRFLAGQWLWVGRNNGKAVRFDHLPLCPDQQRYCGALAPIKKKGIKLEIKDCTEKRNFLCYKKP